MPIADHHQPMPALEITGVKVIEIAQSSDIPTRSAANCGAVFLARDFTLAAKLVKRGFDSARIGVCGYGLTPEWSESIRRTGRDQPVVPPRPHSFPLRILIALPTYNECGNLERMTAAIQQYLECDILIIDDNSPDGTGAIADQLSATDRRVHVLHRATKEGLGRAYLAGYSWALERGYDRIMQMDCDFSHAPWDVPRLAHASLNADLVIGSRYVKGGGAHGWSWSRRRLSQAGNIYSRLFLGSDVHDWTAGFRCLSAGLIRSLNFTGVNSSGYGFQIEVAWRTKQLGRTIREVPITFYERRAGQSKMSGSIVREALAMVPRLRFGTPKASPRGKTAS